MIPLVAGLLIGLVLGILLARILGPRATARQGAVGPHLLPDPALNWLLRAHGALGVWISEVDPTEGPRAERVLNADQLPVSQVTAVDRRLERARDEEQSGVERLDAGTLVFHAAEHVAVGLLLPPAHDPALPGVAAEDLLRLFEGIRRRPQMVALTQAMARDASMESAASVGLQLAYQLERITQGDVVVAALEPTGVRVAGVSGRADRRLLETIALADSPLAQVASGKREGQVIHADPLGGQVADRRHRTEPILLVPLIDAGAPVGAVALWLPSGEEPSGPAMAELHQAISQAGPRLASAVRHQGAERASRVDPLTGLPNRRALDEALSRHGVNAGALVYLDLDHFKQLNDTLGHAAGDAALIHAGRIMESQIRAGDTAARIGGEEFAIWLPTSPLDVGVRIAERIRVRLSTTPWEWQGRHWALSASFGVAACPETSRRLENLAAQADSALYVAKKSGRNRVEAAARTGPTG